MIPLMKRRRITVSRRAMFWPCGTCRRDCNKEGIYCESCSCWFHFSCENISSDHVKLFTSNAKLPFTCVSCFLEEDGAAYNYECALRRLSNAAKYGPDYLSFVCARERLILPEYANAPRERCWIPMHGPSRNIQRVFNMKTVGIPLSSSLDGNCLFSSASIALVGDNRMKCELRVRCCIEMVVNKDRYTAMPQSSDILLTSPSFATSCRDCANLGGYSSQWTIYALSSAIECRINVVYPPVNGNLDVAYKTLNTTCLPSSGNENSTLTIMWTNCAGLDYATDVWTANHFVPLLKNLAPNACEQINRPRRESYSSVVKKRPMSNHSKTVDAKLEFSPISFSTPSKSTNACRKKPRYSRGSPPTACGFSKTPSDSSFVPSPVVCRSPMTPSEVGLGSSPAFRVYPTTPSDVSFGSSPAVCGSPKTPSDASFDSSPTIFGSPKTPADVSFGSSPVVCDSPKALSDASVSGISHSDTSYSDNECERGVEYPRLPAPGKFLSLRQLVEALKSNSVRDCVPCGIKENVFFVVKNSANVDKREVNTRSNYSDDCGAWDSAKGTTVNSCVVLNSAGIAKVVYLKNTLYCTERRAGGNTTWIPIEPQPDAKCVTKLHRYYATLKGTDSYKKRVTCVSGGGFDNLAVVEYNGVRSNTTMPHGNAKKSKIPYIRTHPDILEKISNEVKTKPPRQVYQEMVEDNSFEAPRDFKQVRNIKYKKIRKEGPQRANIADDVLAVLAMLNENPCVQEIIDRKGKPPSVILYSNEQLEDLKKNVSAGSVLGVDRTFNLGACFVTTTVYKNTAVLHKESSDHPLFLGPVYLHWDGEFETYHSFFAHIKAKLKDTLNNVQLRLGSDQELALVKAMKSCFPSAMFVLCSKHMKDNVTRQLSDIIGCRTKERVTIVNKIFGDMGIATSNDLFNFESKVLELFPYFDKYPSFKAYFDKLKPILYSYVCEPYQKGITNDLWTNNNCESLNNILKLSVNWKPQKLPELIERVSGVSRLQMLDLRRALYCNGNYVLLPKFKRYIVKREVWVNKSEEAKAKYFSDFLSRKRVIKCDRIEASGGIPFSIPKVQNIAKKPGQRKRSRSERAK